MKKSNMTTLKRLGQYLKGNTLLVFLILLCTLVSIVASLYIPVLCGRIIDALGTEDPVGNSIEFLIKIAMCTMISNVFSFFASIANYRISFSIVKRIRDDCFDTIMNLPLSYIDSHRTGASVSRVISDVDTFADGLILGVTQLFTAALTIIITLVYMISINPKITALVVILTPLSILFAFFIAKKSYSMFKKQAEIRGDMTGYINEIVTEQKTVRAYSRENVSVETFKEINDRYGKATLKAVFFSSLVNPTTRFVNNIVYAVICMFGALSALTGAMTIGALTSFLAYATQYTKPFNEISGVVSELQNALASIERVFELIDEETEESGDNQSVILTDVLGKVDFNDVSFSYVPEKEFIKDLNIHAAEGERIALVGKTGCGKTTLINLLMRFYEVNSGNITIDSRDITSTTRKSLREAYGMVLQDTWILTGTIRDNILMGRRASEEEVINAAKAAHAHSFIKRLPHGYDTVISDDNSVLSAGQRQLLCIARVMLKIPPILILDEATSSIDTRTEMKIQDAFAKLMKGRTSFVVAHRLSTIRDSDMILVMDSGKLVEKGTHDELLLQNGFYSNMWNSQFAHK